MHLEKKIIVLLSTDIYRTHLYYFLVLSEKNLISFEKLPRSVNFKKTDNRYHIVRYTSNYCKERQYFLIGTFNKKKSDKCKMAKISKILIEQS